MTKSSRQPACNLLTQAALSRMQGAEARQNGGGVPKGSHIGRMQRHIAQTSGGKGEK